MHILTEIEKKFQVDLSKIHNWPLLRRLVGLSLIHSKMDIPKMERTQLILYKIRHALRSFKGIFNIFKKYDTIVFGTFDNFRRIDGDYYVDRFCHDTIINYGLSNTLYVEKTHSYEEKKVPYKIVSYFLFRIFSSFLTSKVKPNKLLADIKIKYDLKIDFNLEERKFTCIYNVFKLYFRLVKPKRVIVTCYSFKSAIKAANDLKIHTMEFQHGVISNNFEYDFRLLNKNNFSPKEIFVFGVADKLYLKKYKYTNKVTVVGNFFQNYVMHNYKPKNLEQDKTTICVSLQDDTYNEVMDIVTYCAKQNEDVNFMIIPRNIVPVLKKDLKNVSVLTNFNLYEIMKISDYHITVYSTSCFEASSFGLKNLFINLKNLSRLYYEEFIENNNYNYVFDEQQNLSEHIMNLGVNESKDEIIAANEYYYSTYKKILIV